MDLFLSFSYSIHWNPYQRPMYLFINSNSDLTTSRQLVSIDMAPAPIFALHAFERE